MELWRVYLPKKTLEQIEQKIWDEEITFPSSLVAKCYRLRKKPINLFSIEDFRLLISQEISLSILIPFALKILEEDSLAEGDLYPGDLLHAVIKVGPSFWEINDVQYKATKEILNTHLELGSTGYPIKHIPSWFL